MLAGRTAGGLRLPSAGKEASTWVYGRVFGRVYGSICTLWYTHLVLYCPVYPPCTPPCCTCPVPSSWLAGGVHGGGVRVPGVECDTFLDTPRESMREPGHHPFHCWTSQRGLITLGYSSFWCILTLQGKSPPWYSGVGVRVGVGQHGNVRNVRVRALRGGFLVQNGENGKKRREATRRIKGAEWLTEGAGHGHLQAISARK